MTIHFTQEFEYEASSGLTYLVEVVGAKYVSIDEDFIDVKSFSVSDEMGNLLEKGDEDFAEIEREVLYRDYDVEEHSTDNSYYGDHNELY